jgi:hypothetical protein
MDMRRVLVPLLLALATAFAAAQDPVNFKVLEMPPEFTTIRNYKVTVIRTEADWKAYWNRYVSANVEDHGQWKPMPIVPVDFKQFEVVAVHLGTQPDAGMQLGVESAILYGETYTVKVTKGYGRMAMHHTSNPAISSSFPRAGVQSPSRSRTQTSERVVGRATALPAAARTSKPDRLRSGTS